MELLYKISRDWWCLLQSYFLLHSWETKSYILSVHFSSQWCNQLWPWWKKGSLTQRDHYCLVNGVGRFELFTFFEKNGLVTRTNTGSCTTSIVKGKRNSSLIWQIKMWSMTGYFLAQRWKFRDAFFVQVAHICHFLFSLYRASFWFSKWYLYNTLNFKVKQFIILHTALTAAMWSVYLIDDVSNPFCNLITVKPLLDTMLGFKDLRKRHNVLHLFAGALVFGVVFICHLSSR